MTAYIYNEDYIETVERLYRAGERVDMVITSPPYNTNKKQGRTRTLLNTDGEGYPWVRYDTVQDAMSNREYCDFIASFMVDMDCIVEENGVVLVNLSYGNENPDGILQAVSSVIEGTEWTVADCIVWRKRNAMPNNCSPNRATRICEFVFVFVRKDELATFHANKPVKSVRKTGQKSFTTFRTTSRPRTTTEGARTTRPRSRRTSYRSWCPCTRAEASSTTRSWGAARRSPLARPWASTASAAR